MWGLGREGERVVVSHSFKYGSWDSLRGERERDRGCVCVCVCVCACVYVSNYKCMYVVCRCVCECVTIIYLIS